MRRALALLTLAGCGAGGVDPSITPDSAWIRPSPPPAPTLPDGVRVRALTLNLHGGQDAPVSRVIEVLGALSLDVIGLEECPPAYADAVAAALSLHRAGEEGNVLLSRTALTATRTVSLRAGRGFVHARTEIGGEPFSLYVAHIGWNAEGSRQCRELVDEHLARDPERRILMVGDFNDEHLSNQATILEEVVEDAATAAGWWPGQRISWPATGFDGSEGSQLIDLLYYRKDDPALVVSVDVLNVVPALSDHKPALAELLYPRGDARFTGVDPFPGRRTPWAVVARSEAANRLSDPGAEQRGLGWTVINGGEIAEGEREHQPPHAGQRQFTGASDGFARDDAVSGWSQRVSLEADVAAVDAGTAVLDVAGFMAVGYREDTDGEVVASSPRPYDEAEVRLDVEDAAGRLLARWTSGRRDTLRHHPFGANVPVPPGARAANLQLLSHLKENSGPSHDAVFDDLYLAVRAASVHGARPERLRVDGESAGWGGWTRLADGEPVGIMIYPPRSRSGGGLLLASGGAVEGSSELAVTPGPLAFEAWARTMTGAGAVTLTLELYEEDAEAPWGRYTLDPVRAPEWTGVSGEVQVPDGITRAVLRAQADAAADLVFLDEVAVR